ncbi:MAG: methyltransferase [Dehalococcoidia bacterium]
MTSTASGSTIVEALKRAVFPSYALLAAIQIDLFTHLSHSYKTAEQLATNMGVDSDKLSALLYPLVLVGLLQVENDGFSNTSEAERFLVRGNPDYMGDEYEAFTSRWRAVSKTAESIRSGKAQAKVDFPSMSREQLDRFYQGSHSQVQAAGRGLATRFDFSPYSRLIDVGGGTGGIAIALVGAYPQLHATVADFASVIPITQQFIDESKVSDRVKVMEADVVEGSLSGSFDVAVLRNFIPVLTKDQARKALKNVWQVLEPGGTIYIADLGTLDDSRLSPQEVVWQNLMFINSFDQGSGRTESERREWLEEAGFVGIERHVYSDAMGVMTAQKPA